MLFKQNFRIYYNHTDAGGVVYHSNYLTFCEQTRSEFLRNVGLEQIKLKQENNILFVVANANISYKHPAKLDDLITVSIEKIDVVGPKLKMLKHVYCENKLLFICDIEIVAINNEYKLYRKIPEFVINKLFNIN